MKSSDALSADLVNLLRAARCPNPGCTGDAYPDENGEPCQCQWCWERSEVLRRVDSQSTVPASNPSVVPLREEARIEAALRYDDSEYQLAFAEGYERATILAARRANRRTGETPAPYGIPEVLAFLRERTEWLRREDQHFAARECNYIRQCIEDTSGRLALKTKPPHEHAFKGIEDHMVCECGVQIMTPEVAKQLGHTRPAHQEIAIADDDGDDL